MRVSTKGRYGLRVMIELARHFDSGPVPVEIIAANQEISSKYIHVLVKGLRLAGLLRASRGRGGGYELARKPSSITALDIITALEGVCTPVHCVCRSDSCPRNASCRARGLWQDLARSIDDVLSRYTLEQLASADSPTGNAYREVPSI